MYLRVHWLFPLLVAAQDFGMRLLSPPIDLLKIPTAPISFPCFYAVFNFTPLDFPQVFLIVSSPLKSKLHQDRCITSTQATFQPRLRTEKALAKRQNCICEVENALVWNNCPLVVQYAHCQLHSDFGYVKPTNNSSSC